MGNSCIQPIKTDRCVKIHTAPQDCIFCKIVKGESPSWKIIENDKAMGILDTYPGVEGHCLIIPKRHVPYWLDLNNTETAIVFNTAKIVAKRIEKVFKSDFVCVFIRGGRVKHTHLVLFPSYKSDKLNGFPQSVLGTAEVDFAKLQEKLRVR